MVHMHHAVDRRRDLLLYGVTAVVAVCTYWFGIGSQHIPTSTDELTYVHITRVTAAGGHLLPLKAEIPALRNLKPPALFWQGIASTNWAKNWSLSRFRCPNVIYTLLTALLVFLLGRKLSGQVITGLVASLVFLAFFSTYRYGRAFLTDAPLTFWLFVPFFALLYRQPCSFDSRILPFVFGICVGIGCFYKSIALVVPVIIVLAWWYWRNRQYQLSSFIVHDAWKLAVICGISLTIFGMWFIMDPDPAAVWQDFVLRQNVSKAQSHGAGYVPTLLWSSNGIWKMLLAYPVNAGLLAFVVVALWYLAWKNRSTLNHSEKLLWMCVLTYLIVFTFPTHRSERYLLPAMPALATLVALSWHQVHPVALRATFIMAGMLFAGLLAASISMQANVAPAKCYPILYWLGLGITGAVILAGLVVPAVLRSTALLIVFLVYLGFAGFMSPLDGSLGTYRADVRRAVDGREVWVPSRSNGREEGYRFQLPGAHIQAYNYGLHPTVTDLSAKYPLFIVRLPLNASESIPGNILGRRLDLSSNHTARQMIDIATGKLAEYLFVQELLIESSENSGYTNR